MAVQIRGSHAHQRRSHRIVTQIISALIICGMQIMIRSITTNLHQAAGQPRFARDPEHLNGLPEHSNNSSAPKSNMTPLLQWMPCLMCSRNQKNITVNSELLALKIQTAITPTVAAGDSFSKNQKKVRFSEAASPAMTIFRPKFNAQKKRTVIMHILMAGFTDSMNA